MRVLYAADTVLPSQSANSLQSVKTVEALAQRGATLVFAVRRLEGSKAAALGYYGAKDCFDVDPAGLQRAFAASWRFAVWVVVRLVRGVRGENFDALYTRSEKVALIASITRKPVLIELHRPFRLRLLRLVVRWAHRVHVVAISEAIREEVIHQAGIPADAVTIARSASAVRVLGAAITRSDSGGDAALRVGYAGHLYEGKGLEILLPLAERCPWADFVVLGGEPRDVIFWQDRAAALSNVTFLGHRPASEIDAVLSTLDVGLLPNQRHVRPSESLDGDIARWTSPMKAFDYMAFGLPIIASNQRNLREFLTDRETALFCEPDSISDWVAALTELRDDADLRRALGRRAQALQRERFTWHARADIILRLLDEVGDGSFRR